MHTRLTASAGLNPAADAAGFTTQRLPVMDSTDSSTSASTSSGCAASRFLASSTQKKTTCRGEAHCPTAAAAAVVTGGAGCACRCQARPSQLLTSYFTYTI